MASSSSEPLALPAPATLLDALPYVDRQYEAMKPEVDAMIAAERGRRRGQQPGDAGQRGSGSGSQRSDDDARRRNG